MSDNPITQPLASSAELDARLQRIDEDRWLSSRYAPEDARERLVAVWLLRLELQRALHASEPMLAKIRIQWWRETIASIAANSVRRHDLSEALAAACEGRPDLIERMLHVIDGFDDVADDHLHTGGHSAANDHISRHMAAEAACTVLAGAALAKNVETAEAEALRLCGAAWVARTTSAPAVDQSWAQARIAARNLRSEFWPAIAHLAIRPTDGPFSRRWRMFSAILLRRLPVN